MNEYFDIAETYGGTVVNMSTYTDNYVNPLEMDVWSLDPNDSKGMVREKGEFMLGLCEQCIGDSLNSRQKSIIDRCVRKLYIDIARSKEKYIPVMSDFYDILMAQPEDEAKDIALSLELFVNGSLNIFNHQTNVDVDNRFTVYGIRDLGTELSPITMLVMMESIQNRIVENGKRTIYEKLQRQCNVLCLVLRLCHKDIVKVTHYRDILLFAPCNVDIQLSHTAVND